MTAEELARKGLTAAADYVARNPEVLTKLTEGFDALRASLASSDEKLIAALPEKHRPLAEDLTRRTRETLEAIERKSAAGEPVDKEMWLLDGYAVEGKQLAAIGAHSAEERIKEAALTAGAIAIKVLIAAALASV